MKKMQTEINQRLLTIMNRYPDSKVKEAMAYSLLAGGKRIRPVLFLETIRSYQQDYEPYIDIACAIEMIHTYSLIHDDLPGMDNDDLRRGKPTCHRQFDEATAILAGDSLLNEAVLVVLETTLTSSLKTEIVSLLYQASGVKGMIYGQELDLQFENKKANLQELEKIHAYKTGALISASLALGATIVAKEDISTWIIIGQKIGLAFQIQDDVLDVIGNTELLGKNTGSDENKQKSTYVTLLGVEAAQNKAEEMFVDVLQELSSLPIQTELLTSIIEMLRKRVK